MPAHITDALMRRYGYTAPVTVREASSDGNGASGDGGRWITLKAKGSDTGTAHVHLSASGHIDKGPAALTGKHIGALSATHDVATADAPDHAVEAMKARYAHLADGARYAADVPSMTIGRDLRDKHAVSVGIPYENTTLRAAIKARSYRFNGSDKTWEKSFASPDEARDEAHALERDHGIPLHAMTPGEAAKTMASYGIAHPFPARFVGKSIDDRQWKGENHEAEPVGARTGYVQMGIVKHVAPAYRQKRRALLDD